MDSLFELAKQHPSIAIYVAIFSILLHGFRYIMSGISDSLDMPGADSTPQYRFWFRMANWAAGNKKRAQIPRIEDSPNFIPAAEAYMKQKLSGTSTGSAS
jgi:hypothetical protein